MTEQQLGTPTGGPITRRPSRATSRVTQAFVNDIRMVTSELSATSADEWENALCDCSGDAGRLDGPTRNQWDTGPAHGTSDTKRTAPTTLPRDDGAGLAEPVYANHGDRRLLPGQVA